MTMIFGVPMAVFMGQLTLGLVNGAFYALLSLGLAVIFGLLKIVNFAHGAQYMLGAFAALLGFRYLGINYWLALILVPLVVGGFGMLMERFLLRRIAHLDHLYGLLLTFGLALIFEGTLINFFGVSGARYATPRDSAGRPEPGLHVPADLPRMGIGSGACYVSFHLVHDRAYPFGRLPAGGYRKLPAHAGVWRERTAADYVDLRVRGWACRLCRRAGGTAVPGVAHHGI